MAIWMQARMNIRFHHMFGSDVNIKLIHEEIYKEEFTVRWVGSLINFWKPNWDVMVLDFNPSYRSISFLYQLAVFALKSPKATIENGFLLTTVSRVNPKLSEYVSNIFRVWRGDQYKQRKLHNFPPILISKFMHSFKNWMLITFKGKKLW